MACYYMELAASIIALASIAVTIAEIALGGCRGWRRSGGSARKAGST